jgi:hypothetical protein
MAADGDVDTSRASVKTYVPAYQREAWDAHADDLDMSRSEFVRSMVQAGRRGFGADAGDQGAKSGQRGASEAEPGDTGQGDTQAATGDDGVEPFEATVLEALEHNRYLGWDELLDAITQDIESKLEETLQDLQAANEVRYSGPNGGYTLER